MLSHTISKYLSVRLVVFDTFIIMMPKIKHELIYIFHWTTSREMLALFAFLLPLLSERSLLTRCKLLTLLPRRDGLFASLKTIVWLARAQIGDISNDPRINCILAGEYNSRLTIANNALSLPPFPHFFPTRLSSRS